MRLDRALVQRLLRELDLGFGATLEIVCVFVRHLRCWILQFLHCRPNEQPGNGVPENHANLGYTGCAIVADFCGLAAEIRNMDQDQRTRGPPNGSGGGGRRSRRGICA